MSKWDNAQTSQRQYQLLENVIKRLYRNLDLIRFIDDLLKASKGQDQKERFIKWSKRIVLGVKRTPDPLHFEAFEEEYRLELQAISEDQKAHDPLKWLDNELGLIQSEGHKEIHDTIVNLADVETKLGIHNFPKELLSTKELKAVLGIKSDSTVDRWRQKGLPFIKVGRKLYFEKPKVIRYLESKRF
tara:strand:+ start:1689 stop:2249 length:561 start_codon:yes stop_codon:yes gene_type:complete